MSSNATLDARAEETMKQDSTRQGRLMDQLRGLGDTLSLQTFRSQTDWANDYKWPDLWTDLTFGFWNSLLVIPGAIAFSIIARLAPINGILSGVYPAIVYSLFGTSKSITIGPDALIAVLVGWTVEREQTLLDKPLTESTFLLTFWVGLSLILLSIVNARGLDTLFSGYLMTGLIMGLSIRIISEQLPQLIGLRIQYPPNVSTFRQIASLFEMKTQLHVPSLVCGLLSLVILLAMAEAQAYLVLKKKFRPASFMPLIFTGVIIFALIGLALYETVPELDLHLSGPFYHWPLPPRLYSDVLPFLQRNASDILVISLLLYAEAQRAYAFCADMDRKVDDRKELFALGLANLVGAFLGCFPTSTSLLRTKAFANTKIKTTLANGLFSGMFTLGVFIASSYLVYYLPKSADAAVVIMIAKGMMELSFFKETLKGGNYLEIFGSVFIIIVSFFLPLPYATVSVLLLVAASITYKLTDPDFIAKVSQKQTNSNMALNNFCTDHPDYFALDMAEFVNFSNASRLGRALKRQLCEKFAAKYSQNSLRKSKGYIAEECLTESRKEKLIMNFSSCDVLDSTTVGLLDHVLSFEYLKKYSIVYILLHNPSKDLFKRILSPSRKVELITKIEQIEPFSVSTGADSDVIVVES